MKERQKKQDFIELQKISTRDQNSETSRNFQDEKRLPNNQNIQQNQFSQDQRQSVVQNTEQILTNNQSHNINNPQLINNNQFHIHQLIHNIITRLFHQIFQKKIIKVMILILLIVSIYWLGTRLVQKKFIMFRKPMFLSTFHFWNYVEVISPQQTNFMAFGYYRQIISLAKLITKQQRIPTTQQLSQFYNITIKQFYKLYKVIRTIQLAKQYSRTKQQSQDLNQPIIDSTNLDIPINRTQYFPEVVDQFKCSSCYSFPVTATIQYLYKYQYNITIKLSQQQLIDCAHENQEDNGCRNGNMTKGFQYARDVGLVSAEKYPYRSVTDRSFQCDNKTIQRFKILPHGNCQAIKGQLVSGNVVAAMINIGELEGYIDGIFTDCKRSELDHGITIVGQTQKQEWIIRNSWGKGWGNYGYFIMGHGNCCGVCSFGIVPRIVMENGEVIKDSEKGKQGKNVN